MSSLHFAIMIFALSFDNQGTTVSGLAYSLEETNPVGGEELSLLPGEYPEWGEDMPVRNKQIMNRLSDPELVAHEKTTTRTADTPAGQFLFVYQRKLPAGFTLFYVAAKPGGKNPAYYSQYYSFPGSEPTDRKIVKFRLDRIDRTFGSFAEVLARVKNSLKTLALAALTDPGQGSYPRAQSRRELVAAIESARAGKVLPHDASQQIVDHLRDEHAAIDLLPPAEDQTFWRMCGGVPRGLRPGRGPGKSVTVATENATLRAGRHILAFLPKGQVLEVYEVQGDWIGVIKRQGPVRGWIETKHLGDAVISQWHGGVTNENTPVVPIASDTARLMVGPYTLATLRRSQSVRLLGEQRAGWSYVETQSEHSGNYAQYYTKYYWSPPSWPPIRGWVRAADVGVHAVTDQPLEAVR